MKPIEKIKAEIERLREYYKKTYAIGSAAKANCLNEVLDFINSLQAEPVSEDLEKEIDKYVNTPENQGNPELKEELSECARHFANIGWNNGYLKGRIDAHIPARELGLPKAYDFKEEVSEDLELASERYACKFSNSKYGHNKVKDAVVWGANWQRELMLKDAVDAKVSFGQPVLLAKPIPTNIAKDGDKVKLIIIKED